ncbi:hypothetical protein JHK87_014962 [Glycine soja]|nr:hypothetical protein JHK87_014962 [Glycine soja]
MKCAVCLGEFEECDMIRKTVKKQPQSKHVQCRTLQRPPPQAPIIAINDATLCLEGNQEVIDKCPCPCLLDGEGECGSGGCGVLERTMHLSITWSFLQSRKAPKTTTATGPKEEDAVELDTWTQDRFNLKLLESWEDSSSQLLLIPFPVAAISDTCLCLKSDQEVINKCPDFVYSTVKENVAVECAVCLSEFEECDMMRHLSVPSFLVISAKEEGLTDDNSDGHPRRRMLGSWTLNRFTLKLIESWEYSSIIAPFNPMLMHFGAKLK